MDSDRERHQGLQDLDKVLTEWKDLTLAENEMIVASDWDGLEDLQLRKANLQRLIEKLEVAFSKNESISDQKKATERRRLKQIASELLALERKNEAILSERLAEADRQLKDSSKSIQSLRHVQKAYGNSRLSFWQAYS